MNNRVAIYPGTFDPFTLGHLEIVEKALNIADKLIIAIAKDSSKVATFSAEERKDIILQEITQFNNQQARVTVEIFSGLLVDFATKYQSCILIRGLRAITDFEYEFQMSCMNSKLAPNINTLFLPASERTHFISSRIVKEIARLGGDISQIASPIVIKYLNKKFNINAKSPLV